MAAVTRNGVYSTRHQPIPSSHSPNQMLLSSGFKTCLLDTPCTRYIIILSEKRQFLWQYQLSAYHAALIQCKNLPYMQQKRCRQQFELEKVEMYCNIYNGYSFSRQQPLENTESENASFLDVYMRPLYLVVITGQNFASESLPSETQVNTSYHQLANC